MKQINFTNGCIKITHKGDSSLHGQKADEMITTMAPEQTLVVAFGDDIPFVFHSNKTNLIGACLITKERAENDYLKTALQQVILRYGLQPKDIECYIGPGLTFSHCPIAKQDIKKFLEKQYVGAIKEVEQTSFLDLQVLLTYQLRDMDIPFDNITVDSGDTFECDDQYNSPLRGDSEKNFLSISLK